MIGKVPMDETSPSTLLDDTECVSHIELKDMMRAMTDAFNKYQTTTTATFQRINTSVDGLAARLDALEARFPHHDPPPSSLLPAALPTTTQRTSSTMTRLMHNSAVAFCVIVKVWEVMVDVILMLLSKIMILMLRLSFLFHHFMDLMMLRLTWIGR
jgi:hypothetical protein